MACLETSQGLSSFLMFSMKRSLGERRFPSAQPIQAVDPVDLMGQLRHIYLTEETSKQYDYISRDMRMLQSLQAVQDAVKGLHKEMDAIRDNIQGVANEIPGVDHFSTMRVTTGMQEVESALERINKTLPAQGEKW